MFWRRLIVQVDAADGDVGRGDVLQDHLEQGRQVFAGVEFERPTNCGPRRR